MREKIQSVGEEDVLLYFGVKRSSSYPDGLEISGEKKWRELSWLPLFLVKSQSY